MFTTIAEFAAEWSQESAGTQRLLDALTDASLKQPVSPEFRTLGRVAWHIVISIPGILSSFGLKAAPVENADTLPSSAKVIADSFRKVSAHAAEVVREQWTDEQLTKVQNRFGNEITNGAALSFLIKHMVHHRGQLTVLMRQAGLIVPAVYGHAREDWKKEGLEEPKI